MTRKFPWYKRYASHALGGMMRLTLEQKGAYGTLIDLCYDRDGPIDDDEREIARLMGCSTRLYRKIRDDLIALEKLFRTPDGRLIVRGYRSGSDEFRESLEPSSGVESGSKTARKLLELGSKTTPDEGKSNTYDRITPSRAPAQGKMEKKKKNKTTTLFTSPKTDPQFARVNRFCYELGRTFDPRDPETSNWPEIIDRMVSEGLDFELDIVEAIRSIIASGRLPADIRTPAFFKQRAEFHSVQRTVHGVKRTIQTEIPSELTAREWEKALVRFLECGVWLAPGPDLTKLDCMAPAQLLEIARTCWAKQGDHPKYSDRDRNFPWRAERADLPGVIWPRATPCERVN